MPKYYLGNRIQLEKSVDVAYSYSETALKDYRAATILHNSGFYNQAGYLYIQSMEKTVKAKICNIIDSTNPYFGNEIKKIGHSLEKSIDFLINILCKGDSTLQEQMKKQICIGILKDLRFEFLNNDLRYPNYYEKHQQYSSLQFSESECKEMKSMADALVNYLNDLGRI